MAALRWRALASTALVVVATVCVFAAASGPIFVPAADQSIFEERLAAGAPGNGLTLVPSRPDGPGSLRRAIAAVPRSPSGAAAFGAPVTTTVAQVRVVSTVDGQPFVADLESRTGMCADLGLAGGSCPRGAGQIALSTRSARALGVRPGQRITVTSSGSPPARLLVVGTFPTGDGLAPRWWGQDPFGFGTGTPTQPRLDDLFAGPSTVAEAVSARDLSYLAQLPFDGRALPASRIGTFTTSLSRYSTRVLRFDGVSASSGLDAVVARSTTDQRAMSTIVAVVDAQLVLLALLVLYFVAARTAESRESEVRLAELRGFRRTGRAMVALLEPVLLLALALPLGIAAAWMVAHVAGPRLFGSGVTPSLDVLSVGAAVSAFAGAVVATVLGAGRATGPNPWPLRASPWSVAADAVAVTVAAVAFVEVVTGGVSDGSRTDTLAAFAPGLLALGLGVLGARLLPLAVRSTLPLTRNSRWVASGLATRRVARRQALSRQLVLVCLGVGLAVFAVAGWRVAGANRSSQSAFEVGADRVLTVSPDPGTDLLTAVRRADPGGRTAMAVVVEHASDGTLLAVDAGRLAAVGSWPTGFGGEAPAAVARRLVPATAPPVRLTGGALRVVADLRRSVAPDPELLATLFDDAYQTTSTVDLGPLLAGEHSYTASTMGDCAGSCRLVDLGVTWTPENDVPGQTAQVPLVIDALSTRASDGPWVPVDAGLSSPSRWHAPGGDVDIDRRGSGLSVVATVDADGAGATFGPADVPAALPAVVTEDQTGNEAVDGTVLAVGLDSSTISVRPVDVVTALPRVGTGASMVDLGLAERLQSGPMLDATQEVWLAPGAPSGIISALEAQGVSVVGVGSAAAQDRTLGDDGMSLAYTAFVLAALLAVLLVIGAAALATVAPGHRRRSEMASLLSSGLDRATLRRWLMGEQALVLGTGTILGVAAGVVAAVVALPSVPEFVGLPPGPGLDYSMPVPWLIATVALVTVGLALTVVAGARGIVRQVTVDDLREDGG